MNLKNLSQKKVRPPLINKNIRARTVLLIDSEGKKIGEVPTSEALEMAQNLELDLVVINEKSMPQIAKIMDYGRHLYDTKRKLRESRKKSTSVKSKAITVKPQISDHDLEWKSKQAIEWLQDKNRVQFIIRAYGRIGTKVELIQKTYENFHKLVSEFGQSQTGLKKVSNVMYEAVFFPSNAIKSKPKGE